MNLFRSSFWDAYFYKPDCYWFVDPEYKTEEIILLSTDNTRLVSLHIKSNALEKQGIIFLLHGRAGNAAQCAQYIKPLLNEGYDIFIPGWRGYGKSEGRPDHNNIAADSVLSLTYFSDQLRAGYKRKIILGLSLGGQVAIHIARLFPDYFDALVTEGAVASFDHAVTDFYPGIKGRFLKRFINRPYAAVEDIKEVHGLPKLIIHSRTDKTISFKNADILFSNSREPKMRLNIQGNHLHGLNKVNGPDYIDAFNKIAAYNANCSVLSET